MEIADLQLILSEQKQDRDSIQRDLQRIAADIHETEHTIGELQADITATERSLEALRRENAPLHRRFTAESEKVAELLRLGQRLGPGEGLQLLLRPERPELLLRLRGYRDYLHRAREQQLAGYRGTVRKFRQAEKRQQTLVRKMLNQRGKLENQQTDLQSYRGEQSQALQAYEAGISRLAQKLEMLLQTLDCAQENTFPGVTPFTQMRGRLSPPVQGRPANRFGAPRAGGQLRWQGIQLPAALGTPVRAVHDGKVVFADWFGDFGLLLILDHGADYLSLYAHNQSLLRSLGAMVRGGEAISTVGHSGDPENGGVYFELRYRGKAVDPVGWWR